VQFGRCSTYESARAYTYIRMVILECQVESRYIRHEEACCCVV